MDDTRLEARLRQANALGLSQTIIIGEEEVSTGSMMGSHHLFGVT
jgi:hypothetical protein